MSPMSHEPYEPLGEELSRAAPSDAVRERVLGACRREMAARAAGERRRRLRHWSLAAGVAVLLALNVVDDQRLAARIDRLTRGTRAVETASRPTPAAVTAWRNRAVMLVALLRDPQAL
jgi:hypothetical protein